MKNTAWIFIFCALFAACLGIYFLRGHQDGEAVARIAQDGRIIREINLSQLDEPLEFDIYTDDGGYNKIRAEKGKIAVIDADCPDGICVRTGYIDNGNIPIVCLPHKLSISIENGGDTVDAVSGGGLNEN